MLIICERCGAPAYYMFVLYGDPGMWTSVHDFCEYHYEKALHRFLTNAGSPYMTYREREDFKLYGAIVDVWAITNKRMANSQMRHMYGIYY